MKDPNEIVKQAQRLLSEEEFMEYMNPPIEGIRILVCGGRNFSNQAFVFRNLDAVHEKRGISCIIAGGATGADFLAAQWAKQEGVDLEEYHADWNSLGRKAGPIRNQQMIDEGKPDGVVAFDGHAGTADMLFRSRRTGLKVWQP